MECDFTRIESEVCWTRRRAKFPWVRPYTITYTNTSRLLRNRITPLLRPIRLF
jgi:hypothetical protein